MTRTTTPKPDPKAAYREAAVIWSGHFANCKAGCNGWGYCPEGEKLRAAANREREKLDR